MVPDSMPQYWLAVFSKGVRDSLDFVKEDRQGIAFGVLVLLLTVLWLAKKHGWRDAVKHWWRTAGEGVVMAIIAWLLVLLLHLPWEPYHLQDDLYKNRQALQTFYDRKQDEMRSCASNLKTESAENQLLSDRVAAQQSLLNSQQGTFNSQQNNLASQQGTVNACVLALAKSAENEVLKISVFNLGVVRGHEKPDVASHSRDYLVMTNKIVSPVRLMIGCKNLVQANGSMLGVGIFTSSWGGKLGPDLWGVGFDSPAWSPTAPMVVTVYFNSDDIQCQFQER